jgi:hypothetical protein
MYFQIYIYFQLIFVALLAVAAARPQAAQPPPAAAAAPAQEPATHSSAPASSANTSTILSSEFVDNGDGSFKWGFETSDGFKAEQTGHTAPPGTGRSGAEGGDEAHEGGGEVIQGSYSYKSPDGQLISVTYIADENVCSSL